MSRTIVRVLTRIAPLSRIAAAASSSRNVPCSIVRTPAASAAMMPGLPWQCAATTRSASPATSTIARSSASVNCWWIGSSISDSTPPEAHTLMTFAPARSCSRTARAHSAGPSASRRSPPPWPKASSHASGKPCTSPCPPVVDRIAPAA